MITIVEGRPGMGKSVWLVAEIIRYLRQGYYVPTNVDIKLDGKALKMMQDVLKIESLDDIVNINIKQLYGKKNWKGQPYKGIKVVLDEVQAYLNSRNWDKLDIHFQLLACTLLHNPHYRLNAGLYEHSMYGFYDTH